MPKLFRSNELVIEGTTSLKFALDHSLRNDFVELCCRCSSVICCRVSPIQKADMVELVKNFYVVLPGSDPIRS